MSHQFFIDLTSSLFLPKVIFDLHEKNVETVGIFEFPIHKFCNLVQLRIGCTRTRTVHCRPQRFRLWVHSEKVFLILLSRLTYFDYIELMPRFSCTIPTITWFRHAEYRIPENFKENQKWDVQILKAPKCPPTAKILRLIKTAPFNFDLRNQFSLICYI